MRNTAILLVLIGRVALADSTTIGPDGIDSKVTGLDGTNIEIGQVEPGRSGKPNFGFPPEDSASNTKPEQVYFRTQLADAGEANAEHATLVAGVMIGDASAGAGFQGVATKAKLHSAAVGSGGEDEFPTDVDRDFAITANNLARLSGADPNDPSRVRRTRAINVSAARTLQISPVENLDGNTHITLFVDWSARVQDILYVVAWGNNNSQPKRVPQDNFNGMTIAASQKEEGSTKYTKFGDVNATFGQPDGTRYAISLIAPGQPVIALRHGDLPLSVNGTSVAAPHVTATAALLQQYSAQQMALPTPNPRFDDSSQRHEVMKAVMMNAADKLNGVHGSTRDVLSQNGLNWTQSVAFTTPQIPLDPFIGAGHLNAKRSVQQLIPGEYDPGVVPSIGRANAS